MLVESGAYYFPGFTTEGYLLAQLVVGYPAN
jgi:hypothetical protein